MDKSSLMTEDEYKARADSINKVKAAMVALSAHDDPNLNLARATLADALTSLADGLALGLSVFAKHVKAQAEDSGRKANYTYWLDDIWEALGHYAYSDRIVDDGGAAHLLNLGYNIKKLHEEIAGRTTLDEPADPEPAEVEEPTISEYEREQPPVPASASAAAAADVGPGGGRSASHP